MIVTQEVKSEPSSWTEDDKQQLKLACTEDLTRINIAFDPIIHATLCDCIVDVVQTATPARPGNFAEFITNSRGKLFAPSSNTYKECYQQEMQIASLAGVTWHTPKILERVGEKQSFYKIFRDDGDGAYLLYTDKNNNLWLKQFLFGAWMQDRVLTLNSVLDANFYVEINSIDHLLVTWLNGDKLSYKVQSLDATGDSAPLLAERAFSLKGANVRRYKAAINNNDDLLFGYVLDTPDSPFYFARLGKNKDVIVETQTPFAVNGSIRVFYDPNNQENILWTEDTATSVTMKYCRGNDSPNCATNETIVNYGVVAGTTARQFDTLLNRGGDILVSWWDTTGISARIYSHLERAWRPAMTIKTSPGNLQVFRSCFLNDGSGFVIWGESNQVYRANISKTGVVGAVGTVFSVAPEATLTVADVDCNQFGYGLVVAGDNTLRKSAFFDAQSVTLSEQFVAQGSDPFFNGGDPFVGNFNGGFILSTRSIGGETALESRHFFYNKR